MDRSFSDDEVAEILSQAAWIEAQTKAGDKSRLSYGEVLAIATEAGISEQSLRQALSNSSSTKKSFLGLSEEVILTFDGELSDEQQKAFLGALDDYGKVQSVQELGTTTKLQLIKGLQFNHISLSRAAGRTKLKVKQIPMLSYFVFLHAPLIAMVTLVSVGISKGMLLMAIISMIVFAIATTLFVMTSLAAVAKSRELAEELRGEILKHLTRSPSALWQNLTTAAEPLPAETGIQELRS